MSCDFDRFIDRRFSESAKWHRYGKGVLPLWVADMDFRSPEPVVRALRERVEHGIFGYPAEPPELRTLVVDRLEDRYQWQVSPEALVFFPGVVTGFNLACHAVTSPGDGVLLQTPVYFPMLSAPANAGATREEMQLTRRPEGHYEIDLDLFEKAITDRTRMFLLCNPHNPVGRVFGHKELAAMAEICLRREVIICSDEIHCDLVFGGSWHVPIASLDTEIANQTITLMAPTKTFNIAGLKCSVAIIQNPQLRERFTAARQGLVGSVGIMGYTATVAAHREGQPWLDALLCYLEGNRDFVFEYVERYLPGVEMDRPEGTYLAWLDCQEADIPGNPQEFFLRQARVALNDGAAFGRGGEGFVRLNFGCPRSTLGQALDRMQEAMQR